MCFEDEAFASQCEGEASIGDLGCPCPENGAWVKNSILLGEYWLITIVSRYKCASDLPVYIAGIPSDAPRARRRATHCTFAQCRPDISVKIDDSQPPQLSLRQLPLPTFWSLTLIVHEGHQLKLLWRSPYICLSHSTALSSSQTQTGVPQA